MQSPFSVCSPKSLAEDVNSSVLYVKPSICFRLKIKKGWELKLAVKAQDSQGNELQGAWGSTIKYLWLKGEDELMFNGHGAVSRGWPAPVINGVKINSPIYHLVKTLLQ